MPQFNKDTVKEIVFKAPKNYFDLASLAHALVTDDINFSFDGSKATITTGYLDINWLSTMLVNEKLREVQFTANNTTYNYLGEEANE